MAHVTDIKVLDHGYVRTVESWGSDEAIIEAARMSTQKGFLGWDPGPCPTCSGSGSVHVDEGWPRAICSDCEGKGHIRGDAALLRYLYTNVPPHSGPFEFAGLIVEVQAPIFIYREWHRHRTQSYAEMSARYAPLPDFNYIPTVERLMMGGGHLTKQAGSAAGAAVLDEQGARSFRELLRRQYEADEEFYQSALASGVPKELARIALPVGRYSRMRASANLRNWLAFLTLRQAPTAQWEIRQYADAVGSIIAERFPRTWTLFATPR